jgi:hypothetical protein
LVAASAGAQGTEEFGLSPKDLQQKIQQVEGLIAKCMQAKGFKYVPADYLTVRRGMRADKNLPNMDEEDFIRKYGYGVATMYTGEPPQLTDGYSPARVGLGEENVRIFASLSSQDQAAYNRALFGRNTDASFAVSLEIENFSRCGGCTLEAIEQAFTPEQRSNSYYNPVDRKVNEHPLMKAALRKYRAAMQEAGFDFDHPDKCEAFIRAQLDQITEGGTIPIGRMTSQQREALERLKTYELKLARINFQLAEELFDPVEERIHKELFPRKVQ